MIVAEILEATMLICFGLSWPLNVYKSIKTKSTKGKSLFFLILIDFGYIAGMASKFFNTSFVWETKWWIFAIYALNFIMVSTDLILYFINLKREKKAALAQ
ncbi:MAG: hypothetical protein MJ239_01850 [Bacilli bacterium]|nr:hypothetical protein [Bacilli bacterium]